MAAPRRDGGRASRRRGPGGVPADTSEGPGWPEASHETTNSANRDAPAGSRRAPRPVAAAPWLSTVTLAPPALADDPRGAVRRQGPAAGWAEPAGAGVGRRDQPVLAQHARVGKPVQQRRLSCVRVPHERHRARGGPGPLLALPPPVAGEVAQL